MDLKELYIRIDGYKTYIVAGIVSSATFAKLVGWIDEATFNTLMGFLVAAGLYSLRDGIKKIE